MDQAKIDLGVLQETNTTGGIYMHELEGYMVMALDAPSRHHGVMEILYQEYSHFTSEVI